MTQSPVSQRYEEATAICTALRFEMIAAGRGEEPSIETSEKTDLLSLRKSAADRSLLTVVTEMIEEYQLWRARYGWVEGAHLQWQAAESAYIHFRQAASAK